MGTPWDRAAERYLTQWVPRFVPYHLDLVRELALAPGQRVLVVTAGPGQEVLAVARAVGDKGKVLATDSSAEMIRICEEQVKKAGFTNVECKQAEAIDTTGGPWNAIVCAFGLWQFDDRGSLLHAWARALAPHGKIGVLTWGPPDEDDPFELLSKDLAALEPEVAQRRTRIEAGREPMQRMFEGAGLSLVRHTALRHTVTFSSADAFVDALCEGCTWRRIAEELGPERLGRVAARFYDRVGGPTEPLTFQPAATLALAALPGAEVGLAGRPSVKAPPLSSESVADAAKEPKNEADSWLERLERIEPWDDIPPDGATPPKRSKD